MIFICSVNSLNMSQDELEKTNKQDGIVVPVGIFSGIDVMAGVAGWLVRLFSTLMGVLRLQACRSVVTQPAGSQMGPR